MSKYFESDHIRINLTNLATKIINSDCVIFGGFTNRKLTFGSIINLIIENYDKDFPLNEDLATQYDEKTGPTMRLQNNVIDILNEIDVDKCLEHVDKPTVPKYVKCLVESFARLPFIEREKLLLKNDTIKPIEYAIDHKKNLQLKFKNKTRTITPIRIVPSKEGTFQYLIGWENQEAISIRLSRIETIRVIGKASTISKDDKKKIDEKLSEYGPTFIEKEPTTVKVRFTDDGKKSYDYSVIHRPIHTAVEDDNVYVFNCSEQQALYFFFRFAGDVEILEPQTLREKFISMYSKGLNAYKQL